MDSSSASHAGHGSRTLINERKHTNGSTTEVLNVHETTDGFCEIDLTYEDSKWAAGAEQPSSTVSRSFVTIPSRIMSELAQKWMEAHPDEARQFAGAGKVS